MTPQEIPAWYETQVRETIQHHRTMCGSNPDCAEVAEYAFRILSKPENVAKLPEVVDLINAVKNLDADLAFGLSVQSEDQISTIEVSYMETQQMLETFKDLLGDGV